MIPLVWFLFAWLILMGLFLLATLLTIMTNLRYGLASFTTYASTLLFLSVTIVALLLTVSYLLSVDWSQTMDLFGNVSQNLKL